MRSLIWAPTSCDFCVSLMNLYVKYRVLQKEGLLECGWQGNNMGAIIYSFNLNISPKMSYGVLECDIVMLQNDMLMILK